MPWTFAHPAAVLPLRRLCPAYLSFAGLVVGSLMPDMGYYAGNFELRPVTHTLRGAAELCVPAGLFVLMLVRLLHRPVAHLLPQPHRTALLALPSPLHPLSARTLGIAALSVLLGALTHIAWDAFTHASGYFVARIDALRAPLFPLGAHMIRAYVVLQHSSTAIGIAALAVMYRRFTNTTQPTNGEGTGSDTRRYARLAVLALAALAIAAPLAWADVLALPAASPPKAAVLVVRMVIYSTTAFALLLAAAALWHARRR